MTRIWYQRIGENLRYRLGPLPTAMGPIRHNAKAKTAKNAIMTPPGGEKLVTE